MEWKDVIWDLSALDLLMSETQLTELRQSCRWVSISVPNIHISSLTGNRALLWMQICPA